MFKKDKVSQTNTPNASQDYFEFIPSAIAILEKPPARHYRVVSWIIMTFVVILVLWLCFSKIDIVVSARGKIVPAGKVKVIQSAGEGTIKEIFVRDGMKVQEGDLLVELNNTSSEADRQRLESNLKKSWLTVRRLKIELGLIDQKLIENNEASTAVTTQNSMLEANLELYHQASLQAQHELDQASSAFNSTEKEFEKQQAKVIYLSANYEDSKRQAASGLIPGRDVDKASYDLTESQKELERLLEQKKEMGARLLSSEVGLKNTETDRSSKLYEQLNEAEFEYESIEKELIKARELVSSQILKAPVSGVVQQLSVSTIGGYVSRAQELLVLVPEDIGLEIDAKILNKDIGFVDQNQTARIKVDAFEFTRYGYLPGDLQWVGSDAIVDEDLGEVYPARIALNDTKLPNKVNGKIAQVVPGMTASVDVVIGQRNLIEYFIAPILRYKDESLRER